MRASRILARALLQEIATFAGLGFAAFVGILLILNIAQEMEDLIAVGLAPSDAWALVRALVPIVVGYAVPVGFLFGILVTVGRMSADLEVLAMRACGIGLTGILVPILVMGLVVSVFTAYLMIQVEPRSRLALRVIMQDVASRGAILDPGQFSNLAGRVVFIDARDARGNLEHVVISDASHPGRPFVVFAERGHFRLDTEAALIRLELENGNLLFQGEGPGVARQRIGFDRFDYQVDAGPLLDIEPSIRPRDLPFGQLLERVRLARRDALPPEIRRRNPHEYEVQLHRRLALPWAPLLFAAVGTPLGLRRARGNRAWGVWACIALVAAYYLVLDMGERLADSGEIPAALAVWLPNGLFALTAGILLVRARRLDA
jgi:lipopolysaccharide export system permease protein